jgi:hypothetical protein
VLIVVSDGKFVIVVGVLGLAEVRMTAAHKLVKDETGVF